MQDIKNLIENYLSNSLIIKKNYILFQEWNKVMHKFKGLTSIKKIENGILYIEVSDERYLYEFNLISSNILNILNNNIKTLILYKIVFFRSKKNNTKRKKKLKKSFDFKDCIKNELEISNAENYIHKHFNTDDSISINLIHIYKKFVYK